MQESADMELIVMYCDSDFADVNFYFGGDDFALTVRETSAATVFVCRKYLPGACVGLVPRRPVGLYCCCPDEKAAASLSRGFATLPDARVDF